MSTSAANIAIEKLFADNWGTTTPVRYDNLGFDVPKTAWVSVEVWDGLSKKASLGNGPQLRRSTGTVFVNIYTPISINGSKPARTYADSIRAIFRDKQVAGITFEEPDVRRIGEQYFSIMGNQSTTQWFQMVVAIPFFQDVII